MTFFVSAASEGKIQTFSDSITKYVEGISITKHVEGIRQAEVILFQGFNINLTAGQ